MSPQRLLIQLCLFLFVSLSAKAQDSTIESLQNIPLKYISAVNSKIDKYSNRIQSKTEKTIAKLSKWENKIHALLQKVNPDAAAKLFGSSQTTFSNVLQKMREGKAIVEDYHAEYNSYRDKLATNLKYLQQQKENLHASLVKPLEKANKKVSTMEKTVADDEALEKFIKERKKQLLEESIKYIGKSKYLAKIDKEAYYYVETMRNYKELFSDPKKAEQLAQKILSKIPAFEKFKSENSQLASLFGLPGTYNSPQNLAGLQTRASVQALVQNRIAAGGPNAQQAFSQRMQYAQGMMNELKDKVLKAGGSSSDADVPGFKPNMQKTKTFFQRLEYGSNFQFTKTNSLVPTTADIGLSIGYKLNDKSIVGLGTSYKVGIGSFQNFKLTSEGLGLRSFIDWKLKKQFFLTGGFEMNYNSEFKNMTQLKDIDQWQQSGLIGLSRKINVNTKWFKGTKLQLLYDMLAYKHVPASQPFVFRIGYSFKN